MTGTEPEPPPEPDESSDERDESVAHRVFQHDHDYMQPPHAYVGDHSYTLPPV